MSAADHLQPAQHDPNQLSLFDMPESEAPAAAAPQARGGGRNSGPHNKAGRSARKGGQSQQQVRPNPMMQEGYQYKLFVNPEEHLAEMAGSTDAPPGTSWAAVRANKLAEAKTPKKDPQGRISRYPRGHPYAGEPVHGAGLHEALVGRNEQVEDPLHVIINPAAHGRKGPLQHEGNHRLEVALDKQNALKAQGVENYHQYVPVEHFETGFESKKAADMKAAAKMANMTTGPGLTTPEYRPPPLPAMNALDTPASAGKRRWLRGGHEPGTWNSKAY
jgi:hypothetical protein